MLSQADAVKQAWAATDRTLDIIVTVDGKDYQATEINSLNYDAGAFTGDTLGIGSTYENSVTIEFSSVVEAFKQGLTVLPKVGILVNGKFEYTKLGTFIISEVNRDRNNNLTTIKALDQMCKLEGQYKPTVSTMAGPLDIIADIANQGGVEANTGELQHLPTLPNIKKIEGQTLRTAIGWIAQLYGGFAAFGRDGKLTIRTTASPDYTITPGEYQQGGLTKNEVAYKTGGIKVTVSTQKADDSGQEVDGTTTLQAGETTGSQIELTNDSMTSDLLTTVWTGIKDITYYPYTLNWFGNPNLEAGDWVTLTDTQGNQFNVPVNQYTMSFNGGLESTISATQSSSTAGGYAYTGSAGSIKNMIEALQVRHTASGNNVYPPSYQGQPKNPKKGDVWYKQNGNNVEVWIYQEDDGKLSWVRAPLDGEVKAELQALGKKNDEDLTRVKSELSSEAENQWQSMKKATSETNQRLTSLQAEQNASLADLRNTADSLHAEVNSLHADADSMRGSLADTGKKLETTTSKVNNDLTSIKSNLSAMGNDLSATKANLADTGKKLETTTSKVNNDLTSIKSNLSAMGNDLSATKANLADTGKKLETTTSEFQRQAGKLSGSLSTANSKIEFNSNAIAEVKRTAGEISTTVSNIRVGGRNLLTNTRTLSDVWNGTTETVDGFTVAKATNTRTDGGTYDIVAWSGLTNIKSNTDYVLTFYAKASKTTGIYSYLYNIGPGDRYMDGSTRNTLTTDYQRYTVHFHTATMPAGRTVNCLPVRLIEKGVTAWIYGLQLEEGNTATQWQPNPADTDQAISKVSQTADAIKADLANTKGDVASIKATASSLQSQITDNKNNISTVKQTADSLTSTVGQMPAKWQQAINDKANAQVLTSGVDMNNLTTAGTYLVKDYSAKNTPIGAYFMATVEATADKSRVVQRVKKDDSSTAYERSNYSSGWTAWERVATGTDITQIKQTIDGISTRVSNTEGNVSGLQQTAKSIQTSVSDNAKNISNVQQTATALQSDLSNAKGDISSLKQTATGLTSRIGNAEGNISQLQQTANGLTSTVSNMKSGGANMLPAGKLTSYYSSTVTYDADSDTYTIVNPAAANASWGSGVALPDKVIEVPWGQTACISMQVYTPTAGEMAVDINNGAAGVTHGNDNDNRNKSALHNSNIPANEWTTFWFTYENSSVSGNPKKASLWDAHTGIGLKLNNVTWKIRHPMVQIGTFPSEWSPSPKDTDSAISQIKQTADQIKADVADNKGNISSVTQTANAVKTDLANTKGDVASVKAKADSLTTLLADAKGNISQLQQTATGLQSTVQSQSGKISQLQQDADGLSTTVGGAAIDVIPNLDKQFVMGYGIANTTWQDGNSYIKLPTTKKNHEVLPQTAGFALTIPWQAGKTYIQSIIFETDATINEDGHQPQWSWFTNDHDWRKATLTKLGDNTYRLIGAYTPTQAKVNSGYLRIFDIANFTNFVDVTTGTYLKFRNPRIWCPDDNSLAQLKLTADGLTSKVADTQGNVSKLQQTASSLQTQITNNKNDVTSVKVTADSVRTDLTNAKNDIASVKFKADSLTSSMTNANNQISTLQHRADSITTTLSQGGNNLLNNSQGNFQPKNSAIDNWARYGGVNVYMTQGRKYTVSAQSAPGFAFGSTHNTTTESNRILLWLVDNNVYQVISSNTTDISQGGTHFTWNHPSGIYTLRVNSYKKDNSGYAYHVQIECGDNATPWQPSNGDISSLQQTASQLTSDMKDAKGNISSLQQTAGGLTTRVSNTEGNISSLQETAKELKATVGDDKTGLVSSVKAIPGQISSAITASKQATVVTSAVDLHNMKAAGYYLLKGALTNSPVTAWAFLRVITSDSGDRVYHRIWKDNASTVYTEEWTGDWSGWATHINSDNLKSNVITAINQSTEGVSITGAKITLDGNVNVAPGFTLSADYIKAGALSADRISGGTLNFSNITVNGLTANSISSGSISGQNLNISLDNGTVEFTKGNLHSTDGGFNISIDTKSFYLDMGNGSKLWINRDGFHLQESATQHLWMNKDGLHNYTDANKNGLRIKDTELSILNSDNAGLVAKDGIIQFSTSPIWNSDNVYSGTLNNQLYGTIGFNSNLLSSSLNGIFIKGREGVVIGTSSYGGGSLFGADGFLDVGQAGSGINLPDDLNKPASIFTKSALTLLGGPTYPASVGMSDKARVCIGCDTYYTHNGASMSSGGNDTRGSNISINARNTNIIGYDWVNIQCRNGRIALDAQWVHSYPTYNHTTSAGANVYVAEDGALIRSSSARKYKTDIQDADNDYGNKLIEFAPQKWIDKAEKKRYEEDPENNKKPGYYYGLIADDLDAAGLDMLVNYGAEGEVEGINYDRLAVALLPVIKSLKNQVASLKKQIKALTK